VRFAYRISLWGDEIERISEIDPLTGEIARRPPAGRHLSRPSTLSRPQDRLEGHRGDSKEMEEQVGLFRVAGQTARGAAHPAAHELRHGDAARGGLLQRHRELQPARWRAPAGSTPWTLLDYFPPDWLLFMDESHMTLPQVRGMYNGDRARKRCWSTTASACPARSTTARSSSSEFEDHINQAVYVSATPGPYEKEHAEQIVEQVIRPTGLVDPIVEVRPTKGQIDDLLREIKIRTVAKGSACW
jgi:excinuclease ABC subunit B